MALRQKLYSNNVEATYWRIVGFNLSITGKMCQIFLSGYKNVDDRAKNINVAARNYMITMDDFDKYVRFEDGVLVANLYKYLKENVEDFKYSESI